MKLGPTRKRVFRKLFSLIIDSKNRRTRDLWDGDAGAGIGLSQTGESVDLPVNPRSPKPRVSGYLADVNGAFCPAETTGKTPKHR
jgi:hypothetical protein